MDEIKNYQDFIQNIIDTRGQWAEEVLNSTRGCERHHILPDCMGGEGDAYDKNKKSTYFYKNSHHPNCIYLYPSEHFLAHQLLVKEYPESKALWAAFWAMCNRNTNCPEKYIYTSEQYEDARNNFTRLHSIAEKERAKNLSVQEKEEHLRKTQETWKNKSKEDMESFIEKRKNTCLNKYGEENWNNQEQRKNTLDKKTTEEKKASIQKRLNTMANKSIGEKEELHNKMSIRFKENWEKASPEKRALWKQRKSKAQSGYKNHQAISVQCINSQKIYGTKKEACEDTGISLGILNRRLASGLPDNNGNYWKILEIKNKGEKYE